MVVGQSPLCLLVHRFKSSGSVEYGKGNNNMGKQVEEPSTKRSKLVSRLTSLAGLLQPVKTAPLKRIGQTLQRSISLNNESQTERAARPLPSSSTMKTRVVSASVSNPSSSMTATRVSTATFPPAKRRDSKLWSETFDVRLGATQPLSPKEIKRQEAIFELAQGEQDLVEDLKLAKKLPCLSSYTSYCSNQVKAKDLLDQKKQDRRVQDFLQRCLQSPFSRKLDLWNFLDIPRSRLVKYPLLVREILKHTPNDHPDRQHLDEAMLRVQSVVADINRRTGESECQFYKDRLLYTEDGQRDELIDRSRTLSCHGELKNNRGLKLHVFLFQDVLVITRSVSLNDQPISYQLCRQPISIRHLDLEDLSDGEMRVGGSIRGAFSNIERTKNFFRVSHRTGGQLQSHCFQASDAFNKQQWINCIRQAKEAAALTGDQPPQTGQCLETALLGQIGLLGETGLSLRSEDKNGVWGAMETGLGVDGEEGLSGEKDLGLGKEVKVGLTGETILGREGGTGVKLDGETGMEGESRQPIGEVETGQVGGEMGAEPGARADWKMDGGGETPGGGAAEDVPALLFSSASPCQEEQTREVMEEERSVSGEGEEDGMDTGEVDSRQREELNLRC
ncbi:hypothetical protein FQN60_009391 [Etheostoma spectabile]|uniref:Rho guanine nucleotide exchange factor 3 n=1 Tax=Etheostoma spectabile TaxID=54343 RepID=A0A5J5DIV8_9PERO|nr:hypothetical protein FQN60_009391 [Etheostoma spectabile]